LKSDTVAAAVDAMVNVAKGPPEPPTHVRLRAEDKPFWDGIIGSRAREEWSPADLVVAAQLARCQFDIETESAALEAESAVIQNQRGTPVMNPRVTVLEQLARRQMAFMRALRMAGLPAGEGRLEAGKRKAERQAKAVQEELEGEDLLA
jgi:hypothetical protein